MGFFDCWFILWCVTLSSHKRSYCSKDLILAHTLARYTCLFIGCLSFCAFLSENLLSTFSTFSILVYLAIQSLFCTSALPHPLPRPLRSLSSPCVRPWSPSWWPRTFLSSTVSSLTCSQESSTPEQRWTPSGQRSPRCAMRCTWCLERQGRSGWRRYVSVCGCVSVWVCVYVGGLASLGSV